MGPLKSFRKTFCEKIHRICQKKNSSQKILSRRASSEKEGSSCSSKKKNQEEKFTGKIFNGTLPDALK